MNFLISLNYRMFSKCDEKSLIDILIKKDKKKVISGAEIYINMASEEEKIYCLNLTQLIKDKNFILQIHSSDIYKISKETIVDYLEYYNKIAGIYNSKVKLTIHPAMEDSKEASIIKTIDTLKFVTEYIKKSNLNLEVLLENLNQIEGMLRCNIFEVYKIVDKVCIAGITLDVGHYVYDYSNNYKGLENTYVSNIKNIHIHDVDNIRKDHHPFYYGNVKVNKTVEYIKKINYKENIVLELGFRNLKGENFEDRIEEYIKQMEYINSYFI